MVPGGGMLFSNGQAYGTDAGFDCRLAGSYDLGRWDGHLWTALSVRIDPEGHASQGPVASADHPQGGGYFRSVDDQGMPQPPYHVVAWWEAEQARIQADLPSPEAWLEQGDRPEQPALRLDPVLIAAFLHWLGAETVRLPTRAEAAHLTSAESSGDGGIWAADDQRLTMVGTSRSQNAALVVMAQNPAGGASSHSDR